MYIWAFAITKPIRVGRNVFRVGKAYRTIIAVKLRYPILFISYQVAGLAARDQAFVAL